MEEQFKLAPLADRLAVALEQPLNKKIKENRLIQNKLPRGNASNMSNDYNTNKDANTDGCVSARYYCNSYRLRIN